MILWDTKKRGGRPDTMQLLKDTWTSFRAEVIFITSNMRGNDEMMQGCRAGKWPVPCTNLDGPSERGTDVGFSGPTRVRYLVGLLTGRLPPAKASRLGLRLLEERRHPLDQSAWDNGAR